MLSDQKFLGIEIGGTKLQLSAVDSFGNIDETVRYTIDSRCNASDIQTKISNGLRQLNSINHIAAVGVGFGGPVNWKTGTVQVSHQVNGWNNFNLAEWLEQLTKKPAVVENDANVAAFAEAIYGCGKGYERVFYITIGSGVGGGMISGGDIYHGKTPGEVEVGHLRMNKEGATVESLCSGWAVNKMIRTFIQQNPESVLAQLAAVNPFPEAALLKPALEKNDPDAKRIIEEIADNLSFALSHIVHLFHPDVIIIGGGLSLLKEYLLVPLQQRMTNYIMHAFLPVPPVFTAALGESVVPIGAAELAKRNWISNTKPGILP